MSDSNPAPLALFVFNRPDHTARTLNALARNTMARETPLVIYSDGPRSAADEPAVEKVRALVRAERLAGRFGSVATFEAPENKGLAASVISGVSEVLSAYGRAVVLEDDLLSAPDFLCFMNACLDYYEKDAKVGSIAGYSPLHRLPRGVSGDVYALPRNGSHGWATWQDRWQAVDWQAKAYDGFAADGRARKSFNRAGIDRARRLDREMAGRASSWSIRFGFSQFLSETLTVYPRDNRILNIGGDGSGVHGARGFAFNTELSDRPIPFRLGPVREDPRVVAAAARLYGGGRVRAAVRELVQRTRGWPPQSVAVARTLAKI
ncbi:MAG: sugar transferase [Pseudomonadota bacterium]